MISDHERNWMNRALPWMHEQDSPSGLTGRRVIGGLWDDVDKRVQACARLVGGRGVVELGPLDGHVTVSLLAAGASHVTVVEPRLENLLKVVARCCAHGYEDRITLMHGEEAPHAGGRVLAHFGVFYHLYYPANALRLYRSLGYETILLDTHTARDGEPAGPGPEGYLGHAFREDGSVAAGVTGGVSWWLTKPELERAIRDAGYRSQLLHEVDDAPNGPRSLRVLT